MNKPIKEVYNYLYGATGKRHYEKMSAVQVKAEMEQCILAGSITSVPIEIKKVEVNPFVFEDDTTFPTDGFDVDFN